VSGFKSFGQGERGFGGIQGKINIDDLVALRAIKMKMLPHVGTVAGGAAVEVDLFGQSTFDQGIEAIIDGGQGDFGHSLFGPHENPFRGGMIPILEQHLIDMLTLRGKPEPAGGESNGQRRIERFGLRLHVKVIKRSHGSASNQYLE